MFRALIASVLANAFLVLSVDADQQFALLKSDNLTMELRIPESIEVTQDGEVARLTHKVGYRHIDPCRMDGEVWVNEMKDFDVSLHVHSGDLVSVVETYATRFYMARPEDASLTSIERIPWSDTAQFGAFNGHMFEASSHGCGARHYYLSDGNARSLYIVRQLVGEFSHATLSRGEALAIPGIMSPELSDQLFRKIIESARFHDGE